MSPFVIFRRRGSVPAAPVPGLARGAAQAIEAHGIGGPRREVLADSSRDGGLVDEVRTLSERGMGRTASRAVGYAEVLAMLGGEIDEAEAQEHTVAATRRLTRKQMGWFGRDPRIVWLDAQAPDVVEQALAVVERADAGTLDPVDLTVPVRRTLGS